MNIEKQNVSALSWQKLLETRREIEWQNHKKRDEHSELLKDVRELERAIAKKQEAMRKTLKTVRDQQSYFEELGAEMVNRPEYKQLPKRKRYG